MFAFCNPVQKCPKENTKREFDGDSHFIPSLLKQITDNSLALWRVNGSDLKLNKNLHRLLS